LGRFVKTVDLINRRVGRAVSWLVLGVVLLQFCVVVFRYLFGVNSAEVQEIITIMHGVVFMLAAAWVLQSDKHVRVDIFYHDAAPRNKMRVNIAGTLLFLLPTMVIILVYGFPYVAESWQVLEGSPEASGVRLRYLQKAAILVFALMMMMQGLSVLLHALAARDGKANVDDN